MSKNKVMQINSPGALAAEAKRLRRQVHNIEVAGRFRLTDAGKVDLATKLYKARVEHASRI